MNPTQTHRSNVNCEYQKQLQRKLVIDEATKNILLQHKSENAAAD